MPEVGTDRSWFRQLRMAAANCRSSGRAQLSQRHPRYSAIDFPWLDRPWLLERFL